MKNILIAIAIIVPLLIAAVAIGVWMTIPPAPDPETLPSLTLEPPSADYQIAVEEGRSIARELIADEKLPGLSLAVAVHGETVWAEGFRWASLENETPVTPETRFRIGGVTKTFTAAAVGLLVERGQLDLDAPVQRYVPGFPEKEWPLSTRQLMAHTSGIRHQGEFFRFDGCEHDADRLAIFAEDPLRFEPGTRVSYSSFGWVLVGAIVAAAANEPYVDFVKREILTTLSMENTVPDLEGKNAAGTAQFYYPRMMLDPRYGLQNAPTTALSCILPAGGYLSTASDLVRFGSAMMGNELLAPSTLQALQTPLPLSSGVPTDQALGWTVRHVPMGADNVPTLVVSHGLEDPVLRRPLSAVTAGGHVSGGTASLLTLPEHGIAIAVVTNVSGAENVASLATRLADLFLSSLPSR